MLPRFVALTGNVCLWTATQLVGTPLRSKVAHHEGTAYVNLSVPENALVPVGVAMVMSTVPAACGGLLAVICESELTVNTAGTAAPKLTLLAPVNPHPVITTTVPPAVGPEIGTTRLIITPVAMAKI